MPASRKRGGLIRLTVQALGIAWMLTVSFGCGESESVTIPEPGSDATSALDFVNKFELGKMLGPTGARFKPDSAQDQGAGKFQIEDTDGARYEVTVTPEGTGFRGSDPVPVK